MEMVDLKGRKGKKRLLALVLAGLMVFSGTGMTPLSVQAETETVQVESTAPEAEVVETTEAAESVVEESTEAGTEASEATAETAEDAATAEAVENVEASDAENVTEAVESSVAESAENAEATVQPAEEAVNGAEATEASAEAATDEAALLAAAEENAVAVQAAGNTYVLDAADLTVESKAANATEQAGTDKYFTLLYHSEGKSSVNKSSAPFSDGYSGTQRINFQRKASTSEASIRFETSAAAKVKVWWVAGGDGRQMIILKEDGSQEAITSVEDTKKNSPYVSELDIAGAGTYYLGGDTNNNYIFKVQVVEEEQIAEGTTVTGDITVADSINAMASGTTVTLKPNKENGKEIPLQAGENKNLTLDAGVQYDIVVSDSSVRATNSKGETFIKTGSENVTDTITLEASTVEVDVTLAEGSVLEDGKKLILVNKDDADDVVEIVPGEKAVVKAGATYSIETDMEDTEVKVNGGDTIKIAGDTTTLEISLKSTLVSVTVTITDSKQAAEEGSITLTNVKDDTDTHVLKNGENVKLTIGASYRVSCSTEGVDAKIDGNTIYTVPKEDSEIEVVVSVIDPNVHEIDLSGGLKAGTEYKGGITVLEDMNFTTSSASQDGVNYVGYVQGSNNPKPNKGAVPTEGAAVKLAAERDGRIRVTFNASNKDVYFLQAADGTPEVIDTFTCGSDLMTKTYNVTAGTTYYLYATGSKIKLYALTVDYRSSVDWDEVETPVLGTPSVEGGTITVPYTAQVGGIYAESLNMTMYDAEGNAVETKVITAQGTSGNAEFQPTASGTYSFQAELVREGETAKVSNKTTEVKFVLPMAAPLGLNAENKGHGNVKFGWLAVAEAESYTVFLDGAVYKEGVTELSISFAGLTVGQTYRFGVAAVRGNDISEAAETELKVTEEAVKTWNYAAFGSGADEMTEGGKNNGFSGSVDTGDLKLWSKNSKGKLVPASTDGLAFYYTTMDAKTENFTLSADITVDNWKFTNGQEGFGLMAADRVGINGDSSTFWNNSYMVSATKVEYYWDAAEGKVSDAGDKYTMKLGVGSQEKTGVTLENLATDTAVNDFHTEMKTLDTSAVAAGGGAGTYNLVGNYEAALKDITDVNLQTTFHMVLQRNNTGYFLSYTNLTTGETVTNKYYHAEDGDELTRLDPNNIYVGFFASRSASVSVSNVEVKTVAPEKDAPAEERPVTYVTPSYTIESAKVANSAEYELVYYGNADGTLNITDSNGAAVVSSQQVTANEKFRVMTTLQKGANTFTVEFAPDADYQPAKYSKLSSYDAVKFEFTVTYNVSDNDTIYVSPSGSSSGDGTRENPKDIYSAVKSVAAGQKIVLMEGTYALDQTVVVDRGMNGTADALIYMIADPEAATRPVLDFQEKCAGMILAGNYWYFQGFDVTGSANAQKGIQVSGSYNTLDDLMAYKNGNTGVQISRYKSTDEKSEWPSHNLILNCTSYLNADAGYEDADGFAAKLTIGEGNVFDGCIAAYNADDGWDLFAKVETGAIGQVVIRNCVAFKNGYVLDENGQEVDAGNGNGFKMGGSSITGQHLLENSVAFGNKAKGIDSNSCPDIQVLRSTSYNNESFNVAFYTNDAKNTAFKASGILSFKDAANAAGETVAEQLKTKGTQVDSDYLNETNFYWMGESSSNTAGVKVSADWFQSVDMNAAINGGITRNADGTINMNGFLAVTSVVPENVGARMTGTPSGVITVDPAPSEDDDDKNDDNNNDNSGDNGNSDNGNNDNSSDNGNSDNGNNDNNGDNGNNDNSNNDNSIDNNNSDNSNADSSDNSSSADSSSAPETVNWSDVTASVQNKVAELAQNSAIAGVNMNIVCSGEVKVPQNVLNTIKGSNVTIAFHSGNGIALSISGQDLKNRDLSRLQNIDLTVEQNSNAIPADVVAAKGGAVNRQLTIKDTGSFSVPVNLHVNVGKENAGKTANLYRYNAEKGRLEYCGSFTVTSNGQSMFAVYRGGSYLVTVTDGRPSESIWYVGGDYIVKAGDTLSKIARRYHMTLAELLGKNGQIANRDVIRVGQTLNLN